MNHPTPVGKNNRVLVIDDNRAIHEDFRKILSDEDPLAAAEARLFGKPAAVSFQITSAFQGEEGLKLVQQASAEGRPFAMAFVDVRMPPGWDGVETTRKLWEVCPDLQIVLCTAYSDYSWNELTDLVGCSDQLLILKKPFDTIEAVQLAHTLTEKWRLLQESKRTVMDLEHAVAQRTTELKSAKAKLQAVLDAATQVSIIATDIEGRITVFNSGAERMLGYRAEEMVGQQTPVLLHLEPEVTEHGRELQKRFGRPITGFDVFVECARQGQSEEREWTYIRKNGSRLTVSLVVTTLREADGTLAGFLGVANDITERKRAEAELLRAMEAAEAATRAKSEFLANMSHEIRTPMNGVLGMTTMLLDSELSAEQRHQAKTISQCGESLLAILNDILDFSKIEAGKLMFETLDFDLHEAVEGCLELLAQRAQSGGLELACLVESNVPARLRGDPGRLRQVLTNLVSNAIKFTERGEVVVKVSLESQTATGPLCPSPPSTPLTASSRGEGGGLEGGEGEKTVRLRFEVKDTGIGIPADIRPRLFQPFSQADASMSRKFGGTGLGLAISRQLVGIMRGEVGIESAPSHGSTFWFTATLERQPEGTQVHPILRGDLVNLRVLIVDDNETNREILQHQTRAWKMRSGTARNSSEALEELRKARSAGDPYRVVLLDLHMPGTNGLALARSLRAESGLAPVRLVLLSSMGDRLDAAELKAAGIDDCLVKPVRQSRLFDCLATLMGGDTAEPVGQARKVSPPAVTVAPPKRKLRILLAEDNTVNQEVAQGLLGKLGYRADIVANGTEVLEALRLIHYDVILMDCQMPELDGYEATRRIRQFEQERAAPFDWKAPQHIIAMTANAMDGDREKCLLAGMNHYLGKPVRLEELRAALARPGNGEVEFPDCTSSEPPSAPGPTATRAVSAETVGVDLVRLREVTDDDPERIRALMDIYLTQTVSLLASIEAAIRSKSGEDLAQAAHKLCGSSISCGVQAFTQPLRDLERFGSAGDLSGAAASFNDIRQTFPRVQMVLSQFVESLPGISLES